MMICSALRKAGTLQAGETFSAVRLPKIFGDGMVLQRDMAVPVWGWAKAGEKVTVSFAGQKKSAVADEGSAWIVCLDAMPASKTPREFTVAGENTLTLKDVLVGEVWLCGGQSNMEVQIVADWGGFPGCLNLEAEIAAATHPTIRQIKAGRCNAATPMDDLDDASSKWTACAPATATQFTAAGYFFAREIAKELNMPIGLINDNLGATPIEPWIPPEGFRLETAAPEMRDISRKVDSWDPTTDIGREAYRRYLAQVKEWIPSAAAALAAKQTPPPIPNPAMPAPNNLQGPWTTWKNCEPTGLFNGMIAPVIPYAIRGAIWYQGESNGGEGVTYLHKMKALIGGWRQLWDEGDFPFYYVQLASFEHSSPDNPAGGDGFARLREAQLQTLAIPNTGMVVAIDIGDAEHPHPANKQDVGKRLAFWALARTYGKDIVFSGPLYKGHAIAGDKVRITFAHAGGGLIAGRKTGLEPVQEDRDGKLKWFAIAGKDKVWHWADAVIDGETVIVSSDKVPAPVAVRYAFAMNPEGANLYNRKGLPASPFRTDDWQ